MIPKYDRLNGMQTEEKTFDLICPSCQADGVKTLDLFKVHVIGVPTKPMEADNSDLPEQYRAQYDRLPTVRDCLLRHIKDSENQKVQFICKTCGPISTGNMKLNKQRIRKWADKHYPEVLHL